MSRRTRPAAIRTIGLAAFCIWWSGARPAAAYCRTRACESGLFGDCERDMEDCATSSAVLGWSGTCIPYSVDRRGCPSQGMDYLALQAAVDRATAAWSSVECDRGRTSLRFMSTAPVDCGRHEFNPQAPNANVVTCRDDDWPYGDKGDVLALTTLTFDTTSGEIEDADVEINTHEAGFYLGEPQRDAYDLDAVLTHEVGHMIGLSHTKRRDSTMFPHFDPEDSSHAELGSDDRTAVCAVYSADAEVTEACEPRNGFGSDCYASTHAPTPAKGEKSVDEPTPRRTGASCTLSTQGRGSAGAPFWLFGASASILGLRRQRSWRARGR